MNGQPPNGEALQRGQVFLLWCPMFFALWIAFSWIPPTPVFHFMDVAAQSGDSGYLLAAASVLVLFNTARAIPLYLAWFLLGDTLSEWHRRTAHLSWALPLAGIPLSYLVMSRMVAPHFGIPAVLSVASVLALLVLTRQVKGWGNKSLALGVLVFSFQWLDIIPSLTAVGAGRGELSLAIKNLALLMDRANVLETTGWIVFFSLFAGAMVTNELLVSYSLRLRQLHLLRAKEQELARLRMNSLEQRNVMEKQHLVHDLKRPLTTILGLSDVLRATLAEGAGRRHADHLSDAALSMSDMISEILSEKARRELPVAEVVDYTLNQVSPFPWRDRIATHLPEPLGRQTVRVNLVRFSRALVNLLDNARRATEGVRDAAIELAVEGREGELAFAVRDNGPGFAKERGDSGWSSTGLGLDYVRGVAENHRGRLEISRAPGITEAAVVLARAAAEEESA
ncbi:MAG: HAMP domain-containing histidine kinase [Synergistales bacterium]|nr:HAMP domain-containing histidine kinase [Synergistales bacterium]